MLGGIDSPAAPSQSIDPQYALHVGEEDLDLLSIPA
jgi:hypothetical protein